MPKVRKRKIPVTATVASTSNTSSSSKPEASRAVIRRFHVLLKRKTQLLKATDRDLARKTELANVEHEIEELGGMESYQRMSTIGQGTDRGGGSEKVLIRWLKDKEMHKKEKKLSRLLEVGALKPDNYESCSTWIDNTPMDLNSRHPSIMEQDFLLLDEEQNHLKWDIISLSLVLNFVPEPSDRGRMLHLANNFLVSGGHLFVALPLPCLANSRYLDFDLFIGLMTFLGFTELQRHWKQGGKMVYHLFQKTMDVPLPLTKLTIPLRLSKKMILRTGDRNNFSILL
ncbi:nucleolus protein [Rhodocollybia butyracea]|uniref:25S rRNA adenine-N(1) methyltransferase n=1 Tax=Rhodocollybia butyracea TaxID=206335 RepID=A0A9P5PYC7_9AGAR|nr:nucleolus protein [Rhodocollybia butyracea]